MILHYIYTMCDVHHVQYLYMYEIILLGSHIDIQLLLKKNYLLFSFKGPLFTTSKNIHVYDCD